METSTQTHTAVTPKDVAFWTGALTRNPFGALGKANTKKQEQAMMRVLGSRVPSFSGAPKVVKELVMMFCSGKLSLEKYSRIPEVLRDDYWAAKKMMSAIDWFAVVPEFSQAASAWCSVEIANEYLDGNLDGAVELASYGISLYPETAELRRKRGILRLAQGDIDGAYEDLVEAKAAEPGMAFINEPLEIARAAVADRSAA